MFGGWGRLGALMPSGKGGPPRAGGDGWAGWAGPNPGRQPDPAAGPGPEGPGLSLIHIYVFGRHGHHKRQPNEIGIHALRMGNVVGEHEVIFATDSQTITLKHQAHDRALFAEGALTAAGFLVGKPAGLYHMDDLLG